MNNSGPQESSPGRQREKDVKYSVVVPAFNAAGTLEELCLRIDNSLAAMGDEYEIIFVDDHSRDNTWEVLDKLYHDYDKVRIIRLTKNFGQQCSTLCGAFKATGEIIITMDDDLQHRPEDIGLLVERVEAGYDIVMAHFKDKKHSLFKRLSSRAMNYLNNMMIGKPTDIYLSSYRAMTRRTVDQMKSINTSYPFFPAMMFAVTANVANVPLEHCATGKQRTTYSLAKYIKIASNLLINNSVILLKIVGLTGLFASMGSFMVAIFLIARKLIFKTVLSGWTSLMVSTYLLGGMILFALGVIGEYLLRIMIETTDKPYYFVKEEKG